MAIMQTPHADKSSRYRRYKRDTTLASKAAQAGTSHPRVLAHARLWPLDRAREKIYVGPDLLERQHRKTKHHLVTH